LCPRGSSEKIVYLHRTGAEPNTCRIPNLSHQRQDEHDSADGQGDLFDAGGWSVAVPVEVVAPSILPDPKALDNTALVAAIPYAGLAACDMLAAEVVARRLVAAVPALEELCRRFKGFGRLHPVREQMTALDTMAALGGTLASAAVTRLVSEGIIEGPGLRTAFAAAVVLKARLPADIVLVSLGDAEPVMRALACYCARFWPQAVPRLIELLDDLHADVADAAAVTLGEMERREAMPRLMRLIQTAPSVQAVDALVAIADDNCFVLLGRVAQKHADLRQKVCQALSEVDNPRAATVLRRLMQP
jgi:hypothetical protein